MPLDIGFGILLTLLVTATSSLPLNLWTVGLGILFALLPDLDFLLYLLRKKADEFSHEHRDLLHNPLIFIPIGFILLAFVGLDLAFLFALCSTAHFLHDSFGIGWGVRWLYPFSRKYYKFLSAKNPAMTIRFMTSWTPEEQRQAASQSGNPHWLRDYLRFSREFIIELTILVIAIIALICFWYS